MISSEQEYGITQEWARRFAASLDTLRTAEAEDAYREMRVAAIGSQLATLRRELAMWEAGIREPLPSVPDLLPPPETPIDEATAAAQLKRAEVANIDRHIRIAHARIEDWRRHRAWLAREIVALEGGAVEADTTGAIPAGDTHGEGAATPVRAVPAAR